MSEHRGMAARRALGLAALVVLASIAVVLVAPGVGLVPGAASDSPRWVLGVFGDGLGVSPGFYLAALYAAFFAYLGVIALAGDLGRRVVYAAIGALVLAFALAPPLLSLDVFSYISYARLGVEHGLNPYDSVPAAIPDDPIASRVDDWRFAVSVYGPAFTLATYPVGALSAGAALWTLKAIAALSVLLVAWIVSRLAAARGVNPAMAAAFVALNPLVLVHVVGGAHNDGLMAVAMMAGVAAVLGAAERAGGALIVLGAAVKAPAVIVAPFALLGSKDRRGLLVGLFGAVAFVLLITALAFGSSAAEALGLVGDNQALSSKWSVPSTVARITGLSADPVRIAFLAAYALGVLWLLVWTARGADWVRAAGWALLGVLVATAWMVPWYVIWALPLAAISRDRLLIVGVLAMTLFQTINAIPI
jgi:alpha-1,6-mannosyltransferase